MQAVLGMLQHYLLWIVPTNSAQLVVSQILCCHTNDLLPTKSDENRAAFQAALLRCGAPVYLLDTTLAPCNTSPTFNRTLLLPNSRAVHCP